MLKLSLAFLTLSAGLTLNSIAHSQDDGLYLDFGVQYADIEGDDGEDIATYDGAILTLAGHVGYNLFPYLAIEGELGIGGKKDENVETYNPLIDFFVPPPEIDLKQKYLVGLSGRFQLPVSDSFTIFAKGGYAQSEFKLISRPGDVGGQTQQVTETNISESGPSYGAGLLYYFSESGGVRLDVTRYEFDTFQNNTVSVGYSHGF